MEARLDYKDWMPLWCEMPGDRLFNWKRVRIASPNGGIEMYDKHYFAIRKGVRITDDLKAAILSYYINEENLSPTSHGTFFDGIVFIEDETHIGIHPTGSHCLLWTRERYGNEPEEASTAYSFIL